MPEVTREMAEAGEQVLFESVGYVINALAVVDAMYLAMKALDPDFRRLDRIDIELQECREIIGHSRNKRDEAAMRYINRCLEEIDTALHGRAPMPQNT